MTEDNQGVTNEHVAEAQEQVQDVQAPVSDKEMNFEAFRQEVQNLKRQNEMLQMQMMQQQPQQAPNDEFDINKFRDDDIPTYGELKRLQAQQQKYQYRYMQTIKDLEMKSRHQDYDKVIKDFLPDVLQDDPDLAIAIKDSPHLPKLAYKLAQASPKYHQQKLASQNQDMVDKIVHNTSRPSPATSARKNASYQDEESRMASMTDDQIMEMFNMAKARS